MLNSVQILGYITRSGSSSPELLKSSEILSGATVRRTAVDQEDLKPY